MLLSHPGYVALNALVSQQQLLGIKVPRQLFLIRNNAVNPLVAFTTYADPPVRHVRFGKSFEEILLPVDRPRDKVVFRQRFFPLT